MAAGQNGAASPQPKKKKPVYANPTAQDASAVAEPVTYNTQQDADPPTYAAGSIPGQPVFTLAAKNALQELLQKTQTQQTVDKYSQQVPLDPAYAAAMEMLQKQMGGTSELETNLKRQAAEQIMQGQQLEGQIGQTTQAMGSRGMGRVAQLQRASELDLLGELTSKQFEAGEQARAAGIQASQEMREIMRYNLEAQAAKHGWNNDELTQQQNAADGFIQSQQNLLALMIEADRMDDDASWENFGKWSAMAWKEWSEAETPEEREKIKAKYFSEGAGWNLDQPGPDLSNPAAPGYYQEDDWYYKIVQNPDGTQTMTLVSKEEYTAAADAAAEAQGG